MEDIFKRKRLVLLEEKILILENKFKKGHFKSAVSISTNTNKLQQLKEKLKQVKLS